MSLLQDFLNENPVEGLTTEVAIADRFRDKKGDLLKFKIRAFTGDELSFYRKVCVTKDEKGKTIVDPVKLNQKICIEATIEPCFKDAESIKKLNAGTAEGYIRKVLKVGEIDRLADKISEFSGYQEFEEEIATAKN